MAELFNLARMTVSGTPGTSTITLLAAVPGHLTFDEAASQAGRTINGKTVTYAIFDGLNREQGRGVYTASGTTLTRATVLASTNAGAKISCSSNAHVIITPAAEDIGVSGTRVVPGGRLTLTTLVPVLTSDVTGAGTVYYTPFETDLISIWDGTQWVTHSFTEISQLLSDTTKQPAAIGTYQVASGFVWSDSGTKRLAFVGWSRAQTFTVTIASPAVFSLTGHGFYEGMPVVFTTSGALPTGLTAGTTYFVISAGLTADAFQVAATVGGAAINTSGTQSGTHTATEKMTSAAEGTGAGTAELELLNGQLVNKNAITNGPAANRGTFVGVVRTNASSQVDMIFGGPGAAGGESCACHVWNAYNQRETAFLNFDNTDSWAYTTATWRLKNAGGSTTANRFTYVAGRSHTARAVNNIVAASNSTTNIVRFVSVGLNATTAIAQNADSGISVAGVNEFNGAIAHFSGPLVKGGGYLAPIEQSTATGTTTWRGDVGAPTQYKSAFHVTLMA